MTKLTSKHRFSGSFIEFDRLLFRLQERGRWTVHDGHRVFVFEHNVAVTWLPRPKAFTIDATNPMCALAMEAQLLRLMKRFGFSEESTKSTEHTKETARPFKANGRLGITSPQRKAKRPQVAPRVAASAKR